MKNTLIRLVFVTVTAMFATNASAATLAGRFNLGSVEPVTVTLTTIDWGRVVFNPGGTGDFAALDTTLGTLADLNAATNPVGTAFVLDYFLTADARPDWNFQLNYINPGFGTIAGCTSASGALCTPFAGSPFTIVNDNVGGSVVYLSLRGTVFEDGIGSPYLANFSTQFTDLTAEEILAQLQDVGFVTSSHSSSWVVTSVPEPASVLLLGTALAGLGLLRRRR